MWLLNLYKEITFFGSTLVALNSFDSLKGIFVHKSNRLCPKSLTTHYIVDYMVSSPFCNAVRIYSDDYSPLNISQNAF